MRLSDSKLGRLSRTDRIYHFVQAEYANLMLFVLAGSCLLLTESRAGIFIGAVCVTALLSLELIRLSRKGIVRFIRRKRFWIPIGVGLAFVIGLAITGIINPYNQEPLLNNAQSRLLMYDTYLTLWLERPLFGHGLGSFNALNDAQTTLDNAAVLVPMGAAHNNLLQWLVQQGLVGTLLMFMICGLIYVPIVRALRLPASLPRHFLRMAFAVTVLIFGHGLVDYALEIPSVMWTYSYIIGLAAGFATIVRAPQSMADE
ncbi:MAG: O-antigen ligase family protein [Pseudomonadota bacterium]